MARSALDPTPTKALLEAWRSGCSDAGERIAASHYPLLVAQAARHPLRRRLSPVPEPAELAQEALCRALSSGLVERFRDRGPGSLRNLLFRVLDRTLLDALRRQRTRKRSANVASLSGDEGDAGCLPARSLVDAREPTPTSSARAREWIEHCRRVLPAREWEIWSLVEVEGHSPQEAAALHGIGGNAARGLLLRARARLIRELSGGADRGAERP